jgi:VanZ family protein
MSGMIRFVRFWLPPVLWMGSIFWGSGDSLSIHHTSRFLVPFIHWLFPALGDHDVAVVQVCVRKAAHMTEYAILTLLFWRATNQTQLGSVRIWPARLAWASWGLAVLYAATDEFHQTFVPSREGSVRDALIDTCGASLAIGALWALGHLRHRWIRRDAGT